MRGLVYGLQNRLHPFESGTHLQDTKKMLNQRKLIEHFLFYGVVEMDANNVSSLLWIILYLHHTYTFIFLSLLSHQEFCGDWRRFL